MPTTSPVGSPIAESMKVLQITGPDTYHIFETAVPVPAANEALVRIEVVTTCPRWDINMMAGRDMFDYSQPPAYPLEPGQPGHEAAGVVVAVGAHVTGLKVGDRVAALEHLSGPGAYAEYVCYKEPELIRLPDNVTFEQAAPIELLKCVLLGMSQFGDLRGRSIVISGLGPAGMLAIQLARIWGASEIVGVDVSQTRINEVNRLGLGAAVHADELGDRVFELGYDCVGAAASIQSLLGRVRDHVVVFGVLRDQVQFGPEQWLRGTKLEAYRYRPFERRDRKLLLDALAHKGLNTACLLTHHVPFSRYGEAVALLKSQEAIKVYTYPGRDL
ncbi:oxidoreductase zinc-binding dehydrogenase family [Paenibacillus sp. 598K]|uniref:alcohol dehydrogenase catalytic domain-containing protein n=1 Tax=Paenibacillus sp. 598K TaxID=1117987 RepID=UPI000FFA2D50|nr:alcohol dehydrogenase catalytic domain-containing protein [Paenibacillus sp. 598K]GBF75172.1 oxidoreductase zinc-binding dehydrogenase family [Paenibacillus sp. 598K]